jgi:hypothetical protein
MTSAFLMNEKTRLRQFWLRLLLALGIMWGTAALIGIVFVFKGTNDSDFDVLAAVFNDLTVFPACILAFWHRRAACIWLMVNGVMLLVAFATFTQRTHELRIGPSVGVGIVMLITVLLSLMELRGWPNALDR